MQKIRKNDTVQILTGRDHGRQGQVVKVFPNENKVLIAGLNQFKKHRKPMGNQAGEIVTIDRPLDVSKVGLVCPKCKTVTRVGFLLAGKTKSRICRKCDNLIDSKPAETKKETKEVKKVTKKKS